MYRFHEIDLERYPNVKRWKEEIETRPGVQRGTAVLAEEEKLGDPTDEAREALFGAKQFDA